MKVINRFLSLLLIPFVLGATELQTQSKGQVYLSDIETYFRNFDGISAGFEQWDVNGAYKTGAMYLQKPGRIRLSYNKPSHLVILGDGEQLYFIDQKSKDVSVMPLAESPAAFLLDPKLDIQKQFRVIDFRYEPSRVTLVLGQKETTDGMSITLTFARAPRLELIQWVILDSQGKKTIVKLGPLDRSAPLKATLFDVHRVLS